MKLVLAGVGHWHASMHFDAAIHAGAEVIGVWDEDAARVRSFAEAHGLTAIERFPDVIAAKPDLVVLMGTPTTVPPRAYSLIDAGIPLVLEKPAAVSTGLLAEVLHAARKSRAFVSVPLPNRFGPAMIRFRELQRLERAGAVAHCHFRVVNGPPERYPLDGVAWMIEPEISGGGALRNLGIHGVDAALSLADGKLRLRDATIANRIHRSPVEDYALLVLEDEAGAIFTVEAGYTYAWMRAGGDFEWRIVSANATLIDRGDAAVCVTLDDGQVADLPAEHTATRYRLCMQDTLQRLARGDAPAISLEDYVAAMEIIDAAYRKGKSWSELESSAQAISAAITRVP